MSAFPTTTPSGTSGKRLVLHIGFGKTGTTALQQFFVDNHKRLVELGICYPKSGRGSVTAHHYLATAVRPGGGTGFEYPESWETQLADLVDEVRANPAPTILLSSEVFSGIMDWSKLELLKRHFDQISIVMYVRRQDNLIMSSYQQWIKDSTLNVDYDEMEALPYLFHMSASSWQKYLGKHPGQIIVRPYEKRQFTGGSIFSDFMQSVFGIANLDGFRLPKRKASNPRLSEAALEFKRRLNKYYPADAAAAMLKPLLDYSMRDEAAKKAAGVEWDGAIFSPEKRRALMTGLFDADNEQLAREFSGRPDGRLFLEPLPDDNDAWRPPSLSAEEALSIGRYVLNRKYRFWHRRKVNALVDCARKSDDPIEAILAMILKEVYGKRACDCPPNPANPNVHERHRQKIREQLAKARQTRSYPANSLDRLDVGSRESLSLTDQTRAGS